MVFVYLSHAAPCHGDLVGMGLNLILYLIKCCLKILEVIKSDIKEEELMKLLASSHQTDIGMPYLW